MEVAIKKNLQWPLLSIAKVFESLNSCVSKRAEVTSTSTSTSLSPTVQFIHRQITFIVVFNSKSDFFQCNCFSLQFDNNHFCRTCSIFLIVRCYFTHVGSQNETAWLSWWNPSFNIQSSDGFKMRCFYENHQNFNVRRKIILSQFILLNIYISL